MQTLNVGNAVLGPSSLVASGRPVSMAFDEDFGNLLSAVGGRAVVALSQILPKTGVLEPSGSGKSFQLARSALTAHEHFIELALASRNAVAALKKSEGENEEARVTRDRANVLIVAYCVLARFAQRLAPVHLVERKDMIPVDFIATSAGTAPYVSRQEWERYREELAAARKIEALLPLEVRLGLDGDRSSLPSRLVQKPASQMGAPRAVPWPAPLMGGPVVRTVGEAALTLSSDVHAAKGRGFYFSVGRSGWGMHAERSDCTDGSILYDRLCKEIESGASHAAIQMTDSVFRAEKLEGLDGPAFCLRPIPIRARPSLENFAVQHA